MRCKRCKKEEIKYVTRQLCNKCYQYLHKREKGLVKPAYTKPTHCKQCGSDAIYCISQALCKSCYLQNYRAKTTEAIGRRHRKPKYNDRYYDPEEYGTINIKRKQ